MFMHCILSTCGSIFPSRMALRLAVLITLYSCLSPAGATEPPVEWQSILEQQDEEINRLKLKVDHLENRDTASATDLTEKRLSVPLLFGGRGAVAFFSTGDNGAFPHDEFRVDEARIQLEAKLGHDEYLFIEANLADHDDDREETWLGDLYVDFEHVSRLWNQDLPVHLRLGRFDIPFGEEYQHRDAIDNPLITHSLTDFWGIDEGVAIFGNAARLDYIIAVQNGSHPFFNDYNSDKSVTIRVGFNPNRAWRVSLSAMRTGDIDAIKDETTEIWYGGGFFRGLGDAQTNGTFKVELAELNVRYRWDSGHLAAAGGMTWYDDSSPGDNKHESVYFSIEAMQDVTDQWFLAGRFSRIESDEGMPIVGLGSFGRNFFTDDLVTTIWRLSLGTGFRINRNLIAKVEYTFEDGERLSGESLDERDMVSAQIAFSF